jgi:cell wall-associated NlpC family hydrolase
VATVPPPPGCLVVGPTIVGVKVYLVQKALGLVGHREIYDRATVAAVKRFQRSHRLVADGLVGPRTWTALRTGQGFCLDRYTAQPTVRPAAAASAHVAAMIAYAKGRIGLPYLWGGAGPIGYDCSGLALQSLYAGGRVLPGFTTDDHVRGDFNTAAAIYASKALTHVPLSKRSTWVVTASSRRSGPRCTPPRSGRTVTRCPPWPARPGDVALRRR